MSSLMVQQTVSDATRVDNNENIDKTVGRWHTSTTVDCLTEMRNWISCNHQAGLLTFSEETFTAAKAVKTHVYVWLCNLQELLQSFRFVSQIICCKVPFWLVQRWWFFVREKIVQRFLDTHTPFNVSVTFIWDPNCYLFWRIFLVLQWKCF